MPRNPEPLRWQTRRAALTKGGAFFAAQALSPNLARAAPTRTLFVAPPSSHDYDPGPGRWDRPERIAAIDGALAGEPFSALIRAEAPPAPLETLMHVHDAAYVARIAAGAPTGVDDAPMSLGAFEAAARAAGGAVLAVDAVMRGAAKNAFVATRPPGHHALPGTPMGFCFFNNAAIAARHAMAAHGAERVAIIDFDVHHGNGAQQIFWDEKNILYCSTHQMPLYPGTGAVSERGAFDNIVNAPLAKGDGGEAFRTAFGERILPRLNAFGPDIVILCAGFDARLHDPLGGLRLAESDFAEVTLRIMEIAARRCGGRVVSLLEGGYRPENLATCVAAHVGALMRA
jgi:acetoin utilization deacetylase AcuC-like enzyme